MRKLQKVLSLVLLVAMLVCSTAFATQTMQAKKGGANVYTTSGKRVTTLSAGTKVTGKFTTYGGKDIFGITSGRYKGCIVAPYTLAKKNINTTIKITKRCKLRSSYTTGSTVKGSFSSGTKVTAQYFYNGFIYVTKGSKSGFVYYKYTNFR